MGRRQETKKLDVGMGDTEKPEHSQRGEGQLTCEEASDLLDEKSCALNIFLHLQAAATHLGLKALGI